MRIRFPMLSGPWATFALTHRWHRSQRATRLPDGRVSVVLQVRVCRELQTWILGFGEHAVVARPANLVEVVGERLKTRRPPMRSRRGCAPRSLRRSVRL